MLPDTTAKWLDGNLSADRGDLFIISYLAQFVKAFFALFSRKLFPIALFAQLAAFSPPPADRACTVACHPV